MQQISRIPLFVATNGVNARMSVGIECFPRDVLEVRQRVVSLPGSLPRQLLHHIGYLRHVFCRLFGLNGQRGVQFGNVLVWCSVQQPNGAHQCFKLGPMHNNSRWQEARMKKTSY